MPVHRLFPENQLSILDAYPQPKIDEIVHKLARYRVFYTFDLISAYHQLKMREDNKVFTAFEAVDGLWEYNRHPFAVSKDLPAFQ